MKEIEATCYVTGYFKAKVIVLEGSTEEELYEAVSSYIDLGDLEHGEYDLDIRIDRK